MTLGAAPRAEAELMANGADAATSNTIAAITLTKPLMAIVSCTADVMASMSVSHGERNGPRQINPEHAALIPRID